MYEIVFVRRPGSGDKPEGGDWQKFMAGQKAALDTASERGWKLICAVPFFTTGGYMGHGGGSWMGGILFYFETGSN